MSTVWVVAKSEWFCPNANNEQLFSYVLTRTTYIRWDDNDIHSVLDLHAYFVKDLYSANTLRQQSAGRHVDPLGHFILIPGQSVFALFLEPTIYRIQGEYAN